MYKVQIDINDWSVQSEFVTIQTNDFDKVQIIQEFIEFQKANGWAADYEQIVDFDFDDMEEDEEDDEEEIIDEQTGGDVYIFNISNAKEEE
jgi:hypothetical protein